MDDRARRHAWFTQAEHRVDVVVVGGGVVGASVHRRLADDGYRVVLVERDDLASGASQGSANLVWGGLLYLARGRIDEVWRWTRERERLLADPSSGVRPVSCAYRPDPSRRNPHLVRAALLAYGLMGGGRGSPLHTHDGCLWFREGILAHPDARRTWDLVADAASPAMVLTRCGLEAVRPGPEGGWTLHLMDRLAGGSSIVHCPMVVNAAGAWAGAVDTQAGIDHGWDIVPSRGVSLVVAGRRDHALMVEHPTEDDVLSLVPFPGAPASIWGSTETLVADPDSALRPADGEIADLVALHRRLVGPLPRGDLCAVRCGVRALAVRRGEKPRRSQDLTRAARLLDHPGGWITVLGGKLTGARAVAAQVAARVVRRLGRRSPAAPCPPLRPPVVRHPGLDQDLPDPAWSREREQCWTLESWLRRRTPVAQVVPRGGFGRNDEHRAVLADLADRLLGDAGPAALAAYAATVTAEEARLDRIVARLDMPDPVSGTPP